MKRVSIIVVFLLSSCFVHAQQMPVSSDSAASVVRLSRPSLLLERPGFTLPFFFVLSAPVKTPSMPLFQSFAGVPQSFMWEQNPSPDLIAPLRLQLLKAENDRPWKITLGAAGTAGAFYIAYKHLKKYGLK